jgi:glycosyltransferase involved in cell wall biosynthesis
MLRVSVVTPCFPIPQEPYRGRSIFETVARLNELAQVQVYCPITIYPYTRHKSSAGLDFFPLRVRYVPYPAIPFVTRAVNGFSSFQVLLPILRRNRPDVLLNYWLYPDGYSALQLGRSLGVPVIVGAIGSDLCARRGVVTRLLTRATLRGADAVITKSDDLRRRAIEAGAAPERVATIRNGCDDTVFSKRPQAEARRELRLPEGPRLILFVGALAEHKGIYDLVAAMLTLVRRGERVRLHMIGEGRCRRKLAAMISEHALEPYIQLEGPRTEREISTWLAAADVFCLPSRREGCPNAILEALSCGTPVVATGAGGIPEIVPPAAGILTPAGDPAKLASALKDALEWRQAGRAITTPVRTWQQVALETLDVCIAVTRGKHRTQALLAQAS